MPSVNNASLSNTRSLYMYYCCFGRSCINRRLLFSGWCLTLRKHDTANTKPRPTTVRTHVPRDYQQKTKVFIDLRVSWLRGKFLKANYSKTSGTTISSNCTPYLVIVTDASEKRDASMLTGTDKTTSRHLWHISERGMTYGYVAKQLYGKTYQPEVRHSCQSTSLLNSTTQRNVYFSRLETFL